jgi:hypothetical protein
VMKGELLDDCTWPTRPPPGQTMRPAH